MIVYMVNSRRREEARVVESKKKSGASSVSCLIGLALSVSSETTRRSAPSVSSGPGHVSSDRPGVSTEATVGVSTEATVGVSTEATAGVPLQGILDILMGCGAAFANTEEVDFLLDLVHNARCTDLEMYKH